MPRRWPLLLWVVLALGCGAREQSALMVVGSTSVQPFAEFLAQDFDESTTAPPVEVQGGGSTAGVQAVQNGIADLGMCSRELSAAESAILTSVVLARDGLAVVVHAGNPVGALTRDQIRELFSGATTSWEAVGGRAQPVRLITREEGSGTREAFQKLVMGRVRISGRALTQESNGAVRELVRQDPCAVGYLSLGLVTADLKPLSIDGMMPSAAAVREGRYALTRPFLFVSKGAPGPRARAFIDFVLSPPSQAALEREGLVSAR